jgi:C4-dicarboxylate-specific signal transduction histidine kinase
MGQRLPHHSLLYTQLYWFIRLRWVAALAVLVGGLVDWRWLTWHPQASSMIALGVGMLGYNSLLWAVLLKMRQRRGPLLAVAWTQILLDMACMALLALWTGGVASPLIGLFVLHMVFASLLLPRRSAYGGAVLAMMLLPGMLWLTGRWPSQRQELLQLIGWAMALLVTVYVANHLTRSLRRQWRRLRRQNRRIRAMGSQIGRHQQAMIQHEKIIALGQMAAGVAHEIANPLASIDSLLQLMQRKPERIGAHSLGTLRQQVERIGQIVKQMTAFAHPSDAQWQQLSVNDVVEQALRILALDERFRRVHLEWWPAADVGTLRGLPQALQQVLVNLILNALDAMVDVPEPRLTVRTWRNAESCHIEVTDNGHGVAAEHMPHLFEPFFTTKPVGKGTGLGLSISYSLVQKQGGRIDVRSSVGQGATFTVVLPAASVAGALLESGSAS